MRRFILIPHLKIHNANAMSSPYTIGFPAMTAWLGAVHALQRHLNKSGYEKIKLFKVGVSCHHFNLQTYKGANDFVHSIVGTANPLGKDGKRPAFIEEARCHLEVSLVVEFSGVSFVDDNEREYFNDCINNYLPRMKFASGDLMSCRKVEQIRVDEDEYGAVKNLTNKLMLGYVLIERRELMAQAMAQGKDALDALLDHLKVMHRPVEDDDGKVTWPSPTRLVKGWLVPIAVGFQGISELGLAKHQRDASTPHRFAESVVTLGEFIMPYRITDLDDMLWQYHVDLEHDLYVCQTDLSNTLIQHSITQTA